MKDNKICFNKTLTYLILLVAAVVGAFYVMNYANNQKIGGEPRAGGVKCYSNTTYSYNCNVDGSTKTVSYWIGYSGGKRDYYKDSGCTQKITEGLGNYCKSLSGNKSNCVKAYCNSPKGYKPLYTKDNMYYTNSSCLGVIGKEEGGSFTALTSSNIEEDYCKKNWSEIIPLQYDCPAPNPDIMFYYKNGQYYKDYQKQVRVTDFGVGNFCKVVKSLSGSPIPLQESIVSTSCKELNIDTNNTPNKPVSVYAGDLYAEKDVNSFGKYFLGTSRASAYTSDFSKVKEYCQASSAKDYISTNCFARLCANDPSKKFYMKGGIIYNSNVCSESTKSTYSVVCN